MRISRDSYYCRHCRHSWVGFDSWAGLGKDHLSPWTRRIAALAASSWSFDVASDRLWEMCRVKISDQSIRRVSQEVGSKAQAWLAKSERATKPLKKASGKTELYVDGTMVNTRGGWREMKLTAIAKRPLGQPAKVHEWSKRVLPDTTARVVIAKVCDAHEVGSVLKRWSAQLELGQGQDVSALGDGAKWIWSQFYGVLPQVEGSLDVYHLMEHLHACGKELYGETDKALAWAGQERRKLMDKGPRWYLRSLRRRIGAARERGQEAMAQIRSLCELLKYLWPNRARLDYKSRLERGLAIGSGLIEGACKTVVGRRLKLNSARWNVDGAEPIAALCSLHYSDLWNDFWKDPASAA